MTGILCALVGSGSAPILDTQTVTVGSFSGFLGAAYGFRAAVGGSITDGTFNPKGGATITRLSYDTSTNLLTFVLGSSQTNDGWNAVNISGTTYERASASYNSGNPTSWGWSGGANPFGSTVGATVVATFT